MSERTPRDRIVDMLFSSSALEEQFKSLRDIVHDGSYARTCLENAIAASHRSWESANALLTEYDDAQ